MTVYTNYKQKVLDLFPLVQARAQALNQPEVFERLENARAHLVNGRLHVVVCGEFKRGKSQLVNALLGVPGLCPVDIDITTSIVTIIAWAEREQITVVLSEPGREQTQEITQDEIADYVTERGNPHNRRQVQRLHILGPFAPLKDGLVLVDTPGIGGLNTEHGVVTYAILSESDAAIFVTDALKPLTTPELAFVRDWVARYCRRILFAITKKDARPDYQKSVDNARKKLAATLDCPGDTLTIVPVSSRLKLDYLASGEAEDLAESNFPALEEALWRELGAQAMPILLSGALSALSQAIVDLRIPLEAERDVYKETSAKRRAEIEAARERLKTLQSKNAHWLKEINDSLSDTGKALRRKIQDVDLALKKQLADNVINPDLAEHPEQIVERIAPKIIALSLEVRDGIKTQGIELQVRLNSITRLKLSAADSLAFDESPLPEKPTIHGRPMTWWQRSMEFLSATWDLLIGVIFNPIRTLQRVSDSYKKAFRGESLSAGQIQTRLHHYLAECNLIITRDLEDGISELRRSLRRELAEQIQQDINRCNNILKKMEEAGRVPSAKVGPHLAATDQAIKQLEKLQQQIDELAEAVTRGVDSSSVPPHSQELGPAPAGDTRWGDFAE